MQNYCSLGRRLLIMVYDAVVMLGLLILASAAALPFGNPQKVAFQDFWFTAWLVLVCGGYLTVGWRYGGMTLGMRAWKVRLASDDGKEISWPRCVLRFIASLVSVLVFGLGFLWALFDSKKRTWHDLAAHTLLLRTGN
jgi:uncharacterized RDD family membrane protein YckC